MSPELFQSVRDELRTNCSSTRFRLVCGNVIYCFIIRSSPSEFQTTDCVWSCGKNCRLRSVKDREESSESLSEWNRTCWLLKCVFIFWQQKLKKVLKPLVSVSKLQQFVWTHKEWGWKHFKIKESQCQTVTAAIFTQRWRHRAATALRHLYIFTQNQTTAASRVWL